jgi:predicted alpha/beta hydrolase family esterase
MKIIYLAGINNSGPGHWQYSWFERLGGVWVNHREWDQPTGEEWIADLTEALAENPGPKILLGHSLGSLLVSQWAAIHRDPGIQGAFLVAHPDPRSRAFPKEAKGFRAPGAVRFTYPTAIVASRNDPYAPFDYAERLAGLWGSRMIDAGEKGHINLQSGLGDWEDGLRIFQSFYEECLSRV